MKVKALSNNSRNFTHMGIDDQQDRTLIYLHGISKSGEDQWYESKRDFTSSTALNYFYAGQYKVVFAGGLTKSSNTNWC